jgi:hypothetical protein
MYKNLILIIFLLYTSFVFADDKNSFFSEDFVKEQLKGVDVDRKGQTNSDKSGKQELSDKSALTISVSLSLDSENVSQSLSLLKELQELSEYQGLRVKALILSKALDGKSATSNLKSLVEGFQSKGVFVSYIDQQLANMQNVEFKIPNRLIVEVISGSYFVDLSGGLKNLFGSNNQFLIPKSAQFIPKSGNFAVNQNQPANQHKSANPTSHGFEF